MLVPSECRPVPVHVDLGHLPAPWRRDVHFFANVEEVVFGNEAERRILEEQVGGVEFHGGRFVPVLDLMFRGSGGNVLHLQRPPDPVLYQYFQQLGLTLPRIELFSRSGYSHPMRLAALLMGTPQRWIDGYVTDPVLERLGMLTGKKTVSSHDASRRANDKVQLHHFLEEQGLSTIPTLYASSPGKVKACLRELNLLGFTSAVLKSAIGASGVGFLKVPTSESAWLSIPDYFFFDGPCMVQAWLEAGCMGIEEILSPSVQIFLKEEELFLYDLTEQFLSSACVFKGNECPPAFMARNDCAGVREEILGQAEVVASWLHQLGLRGPAGIDFLLARSRRGFSVHVCEANGRTTGATYPSFLARHLSENGAWLMRNLKFKRTVPTDRMLNLLDHHGYLYAPGKACGILPYNLYTFELGEVEQGQFLVIGSDVPFCERMLLGAESDLPIDWDYERA